MFTGIVEGTATVVNAEHLPGLTRYTFEFPEDKSSTKIGASVAINGTCLTVTSAARNCLSFDLMAETLNLTNLTNLNVGTQVNFEHAAKMGDEIGGHVLSGHIHCTAPVVALEPTENNLAVTIEIPEAWLNYVFYKGYVAINGASLTIGDLKDRLLTVYLIPETLRLTTFSDISIGDELNIEIDSQTQTVVDTLEKLLPIYLTKHGVS